MSIIQDMISMKYIVAKDGKEIGMYETVAEAKQAWKEFLEKGNVVEVPKKKLKKKPGPKKGFKKAKPGRPKKK